jgi:hypothetical protein
MWWQERMHTRGQRYLPRLPFLAAKLYHRGTQFEPRRLNQTGMIRLILPTLAPADSFSDLPQGGRWASRETAVLGLARPSTMQT